MWCEGTRCGKDGQPREKIAADDAHQFHEVEIIFFRKSQSRLTQLHSREVGGTDGIAHRRRLEGKVLVGHKADATIVIGNINDAYHHSWGIYNKVIFSEMNLATIE